MVTYVSAGSAPKSAEELVISLRKIRENSKNLAETVVVTYRGPYYDLKVKLVSKEPAWHGLNLDLLESALRLASTMRGTWLLVKSGSLRRLDWCKPELELFIGSTRATLSILVPEEGHQRIRKVLDGFLFILEDGSYVTDDKRIYRLIAYGVGYVGDTGLDRG